LMKLMIILCGKGANMHVSSNEKRSSVTQRKK